MDQSKHDEQVDHPDQAVTEAAAATLYAFRPRNTDIPSPVEPEFVSHAQLASRVAHALTVDHDSDSVTDGLPTEVTAMDMLNALVLLESVRERADVLECFFTEKLKHGGLTWEQIGAARGRSANAAQQRYRRAGGQETWPTRRPQQPQ
ncbi:hypothetical protein OHS18_13225 [Amycolatopsis sp. NBC_00355]|uniref:hypothetical protein n=1 Tax=Amycolatopsis sp. NBC_00355 TaxID=2975957 RepID=UPI002E25D8F2